MNKGGNMFSRGPSRIFLLLFLVLLPVRQPATAQTHFGMLVESSDITVPDFRGKTLQQVKQFDSTQKDIKHVFRSISPSGPDSGVVAAQSVLPNTRVRPATIDLSLTLTQKPNPWPDAIVNAIAQGLANHPKPKAVVPQLYGQTLNNAQRLLEQARLRLSISGDNPAGVVVLQSPAAGIAVDNGSTVTATFSVPRTVVPSVYGFTLDAATRALAAADLQVGVATGAEVGNATVKTQSVAPGTELPRGSSVDLELAGIVPPPPQVSVPNLLTRSAGDAIDTLARVSLRAPRVSRTANGVVASQTPAAGTLVDPGTVVDFTLAMPLVNVPSLTQQSEEDATGEVQSVSLVGRVTHNKDWVAGSTNYVVQQEPAAGTAVPMGSTVSFVVGKQTATSSWPAGKGATTSLWPVAALSLLVLGTAGFFGWKLIRPGPLPAPPAPKPTPPGPVLATCTLVPRGGVAHVGTSDDAGPSIHFKLELHDLTSAGQVTPSDDPAITRKGWHP